MAALAVLVLAMMAFALGSNVSDRNWGWAALDVFVAVYWLSILFGCGAS